MARYGNYETGRELYRSGVVVVLAARAADASGPEAFAVKVCHASEDILGTEAARAAVAEFLSRTKVQRRAAGPHWAPVLEAGSCAEGAYCVTALYARSAQRLVAGRIKLDTASLRTIVAGVLGGLNQLQASCGRAHGAIKPANVLIGGAAPAPIAEVMLSDPADAGKGAGSPTLAGDLRAVGELVYQLMMHEAPLARGGWPVPLTEAWKRLGPGAKAWHEFCNRLLDPGLASQTISLEEVLGAVPVPVKKSRTKPILIAGAGVLLLAIGSVVAYRAMHPPPIEHPLPPADAAHWVPLAKEYKDWFGGFLEALQDKRSRQELATDPFIDSLAKGLGPDLSKLDFSAVTGSQQSSVTPEHVADDSERAADHPEMLTVEALQRLAQAEKKVGDLKARFDTVAMLKEWSLFKKAREAADLCGKHGWKGLESHLRSLTDAVKPDKKLVESVRDVRRNVDMYDRVSNLDKACQDMIDAGDPGLEQLFPYIGQGLSAGELPKDAAAINKALSELEDLLKKITTVLDSPLWKEEIDKEQFKARPRQSIAGDARLGTLVNAWLADVKKDDYALATAPDPRKSEPWVAALGTSIPGDIGKLRALGVQAETISGFEARARDLETRRKDRAALHWSKRNQDQISKSGGEIRQGIESLATDITSELAVANQSAADLVTSLKSPTSFPIDSPSLKQAWERQRDAMLAHVGSSPPQIETQRKRIQGFLKSLMESLPEPAFTGPARPWQADFVGAARQKREETLASIANELQWDEQSNPKPPPSLDSSKNTYATWLEGLRKIGADLMEVEARADALYGLDEAVDSRTLKAIAQGLHTQAGAPEFAPVGKAIGQVLARIDRASAVSASAESLLPQLTQAMQPPQPDAFMAATAWRLMESAYAGAPSLEVLRGEIAAQRFLLDSLPAAADAAALRVAESGRDGARAARTKDLRAEISGQARKRWIGFMTRAAGADLTTAVSLVRDAKADKKYAEEARVDLIGDEGTLPPDVQFNMALADFTGAIGRLDPKLPDKGEAAKCIQDFQQASRRITGLKPGKPQEDLVAKLAEFTGEGVVKQIRPEDLGPGSLPADTRWTPDNKDGDLTFERGGVKIRFHRVEQAPDIDTFISVNEISVRQVIAAMTSPSQWSDLKVALQAKDRDDRDGPRAWEWHSAQGDAPLSHAENWVRAGPSLNPVFGDPVDPNKAKSAYPDRGLIDDPKAPTDNTPINFVTPEGALYIAQLLGCRLPTTAEWKAAAADEMAAGGQAGDASAFAQQVIAASVTSPVANLRDAVWELQLKYGRDFTGVATQARAYNRSYAIKRFREAAQRDGNSYTFNDHTLWLWDVGTGSGKHFHDLIGNVAEFVIDGMNAAPVGPDITIAALWDAIKPAPGGPKVSVIGGSALSPKDSPLDQPVEMPLERNRAENSFSDVGFRLAFPANGAASGQSLAVKTKDLLKTPPYFRVENAGG